MFNNSVISIDLGSSYIKMVEGKQMGNNVLVSNFATIQTPEDSYEDGRIINIRKMKEVLFNTFKENKFKGKKIIFTIQSTSVISREIVLPKAKPSEMDNMVKYEVEQYLPIMLDDYAIQYRVIEELKEENSNKFRIQVIALPKLIVEMYLELIKELNFKPIALDINSNSVSKLFSTEVVVNDENYSFDKTVSFIDLGHRFINVNIIKNGASHFNRIITKGGKDIDLTLANSSNLSIAEAKNKKISFSNNKGMENDNISSKILEDIISDRINEWANEISRIFQYYISRKREFTIDFIYLYGGSSNLNNIKKLLSDSLNLPVYTIEAISNVKTDKKLANIELTSYLNAIGAIIRK